MPSGESSQDGHTAPRQPEPIDWRPPQPLRVRVGRALAVPAVLGVAVFIVAVVVAIAMVALRPHAPTEPVGDGADRESAAVQGAPLADDAGAAGDGGAEFGAATDAAGASPVWVHVVGAVHQPGVVELPAGARVQAALEAAGGATPEAVLAGVNLARTVVDGEQIFVPDAAHPVPPASAPVADGGTSAGAGGPINLNSADLAALESLPRVGPALAQRILDWRESNGPFSSVDQLLEVSGIGPKTLEGFRDRIGVG